MSKLNLSQEQLHCFLDYNHLTGDFFWKTNISNSIKVGEKAGYVSNGYVKITINYFSYLAHRLAWLHFYGKWPDGMLDHIDRDGTNNRIDNLRIATMHQNNLNHGVSARNALGVRGVSYAKHAKKYKAVAVFNNKHHFLGYYNDIESASAAYHNFAKEKHGEFYSNVLQK